mmetsp:Transcript_116832/g.342116  ORF Transcript_116832/g.342116 Transcript_116832/m.342116 type:complete len:239 (-) Transcript_116832:1044-1760(-)
MLKHSLNELGHCTGLGCRAHTGTLLQLWERQRRAQSSLHRRLWRMVQHWRQLWGWQVKVLLGTTLQRLQRHCRPSDTAALKLFDSSKLRLITVLMGGKMPTCQRSAVVPPVDLIDKCRGVPEVSVQGSARVEWLSTGSVPKQNERSTFCGAVRVPQIADCAVRGPEGSLDPPGSARRGLYPLLECLHRFSQCKHTGWSGVIKQHAECLRKSVHRWRGRCCGTDLGQNIGRQAKEPEPA